VPISYFYYINDFRQPDYKQLKELEIYFFRSAFTNRFSSAVETNLNADIKIMKKIKNNESVDWNSHIQFTLDLDTLKSWLMEPFSTSNSFDKGVLCIFAYHEPKRSNDNSTVLLDNSWLSISTSRNYHHFFPK